MGHIVCEFDLENTHIRICDDFCRKAEQEDVEKVLTEIVERAAKYFQTEKT